VALQEKEKGLDSGIERATVVVVVVLVERKVEFLEIIALIFDLEEEDEALAEEVVDSTVVEHLVQSQNRVYV
jgi:hypothetical protein